MKGPGSDSQAIRLILDGLVSAGCSVVEVADDTWNMGDRTQAKTASEAADLVCGVDEAYVFLQVPDGGYAWVFFVLGNEPREVASDYTVNLSPFIDPITEPWWS